MKTLNVAGAMLSVYLLAIFIVFFLQQGSANNIPLDILTLTTLCIAISSGLYASRFHSFRSSHGRAILLISMAMLVVFIGNTIRIFYSVSIDIGNPPIIVIFLWMLQYPFFLAGLYFAWMTMRAPFRRKWFAATALLVIISTVSAFLCFTLLLPITDASTFSMEMPIFGDIAILNTLLIVLMFTFGGKMFRLWVTILLSTFTIRVSHMLFTTGAYIANFTGTAPQYMSIGLVLFNIGYLLMTFGFLYNVEMFRDMMAKMKGELAQTKDVTDEALAGRKPAKKRQPLLS
jgi:hypothetical protein